MTANGYAVNTETVEEYIKNDAQPAYDMFQRIVGWLEENNPKNYGPELLTGPPPEQQGAATDFHNECHRFIGLMIEFYDTILQREREVVNTLGLLVTNGQHAVAAYRKQEEKAASLFEGILRQLDERR